MASALYGDWKKAGITLKRLSVELFPVAKATLYENGELILERLIQHIDSQDLGWEDLAERTIQLKQGDDTIYVETGWLKENLGVRRIKSSVSGSTIFIGASPWKTHAPSGLKFSDLLVMLEYGTENMPPRPLIRPTWEELEREVKQNYVKAIQDIIRGR